MKPNVFFLSLLVVILTTTWSHAQSTPSTWIRVQSNDEAIFKDQKIGLNNCYISLKVVKARINPKANWWTNLVSKNRKAFITAEINATYPSSPTFSDKRSSAGTDLVKSKVPIDIGWGRSLVQTLPTSFSALNIKLALNTTAKDGVDDVIKVAQDVSSTTPPLTVAQSALGIVSGAKSILDQLFNRQLAVPQIASEFDMVASSALTNKPGYYVIFGGEVAGDYDQYATSPNKLKWDGTVLTFNGQQINDVSYFVILLESQKQYFETKNIDVFAAMKAPWAKLYMESINAPDQIIDQKSYETSLALVRNNLSIARGFFYADDSYLPGERQAIHNMVVNEVQSRIQNRANAFKLATGPATPAATQPTINPSGTNPIPTPTTAPASSNSITPSTGGGVIVLSPLAEQLLKAQAAIKNAQSQISTTGKLKEELKAATEYNRLLNMASLKEADDALYMMQQLKQVKSNLR